MFFKHHIETIAFAILLYDARKGQAKLISPQTVLALSLGILLSGCNLSPDVSRRYWKLITVVTSSVTAFFCYWVVSKKSEAEGQDDVIIPCWPSWTSKISIYLATAVCSLLSMLVACELSVTSMTTLSKFQWALCTFENYLHAFALLPQLVLCHHQGSVSPAAIRFLFISGVKDVYEFAGDVHASYQEDNWNSHDISYLSGDFVAVCIVLDFLYLVVKSKNIFLLAGTQALELPEYEKSGDALPGARPVADSRPTFFGFSVYTKARNMNLFAFIGTMTLAIVGAYTEVLNVWAMVFAGLVFAAMRWTGRAGVHPGKMEKEEKCFA